MRGPERWDEVLAWMASDAECSRYDWTRTYGGWNAFQLAAREGCGDALANMHVNCIDKTPARARIRRRRPGGRSTPTRRRGIRRRLCGARRVQHASPHRHRMGEPRPRDVTGDHQVRQASHRPHDPDVTAVQENVGTPLHAAAAAGATFGNFFRYLLQKGPDAMEVRHDDKTPKELAKGIYESLTKELRASKQAARVSRVGLRPLRETNVYGSDMEERLGWYDSPETEALLRHIDDVKERQQHTQLCFEDMVEHRRKSARMERIARLEAGEADEPENRRRRLPLERKRRRRRSSGRRGSARWSGSAPRA